MFGPWYIWINWEENSLWCWAWFYQAAVCFSYTWWLQRLPIWRFRVHLASFPLWASMHWTAWALNFFQPTSGTIIVVAMDYGHPERAFVFKKLDFLGLGRHFGLKLFEAFGVFSAGLSAPILVLWVPFPCFPLFLHKTKPLYSTPKYLFGSRIWIWAAKNLRFRLRVSVVRGCSYAA